MNNYRERLLNWMFALIVLNSAITAFIILQLTFFQPRISASFPIAQLGDTEEIQLLRAELLATQRYHQDVLSTLWGALASIATVIVVVTILGGIQNARVYERDLEALKAYAQQQVKTSEAQLKIDAEAQATKLLEDARQEAKKQDEALRSESMQTLNVAILAAEATLQERITTAEQTLWQLQMATAHAHAKSAIRTSDQQSFWVPMLGAIFAAVKTQELGANRGIENESGMLTALIRTLESNPEWHPSSWEKIDLSYTCNVCIQIMALWWTELRIN